MKKKIISVLMCTVMAFAFAIPISAEGDVELHGSYVWCPNCAGAAKATKDTKSYYGYQPCTQHNYSYGFDYCRFIDTITTVYCSSCGYEKTNTTTTYSVISCGGYN